MKKLILFAILFCSIYVVAALPSGPDDLIIVSNSSHLLSPYQINISGGQIARLNLTIEAQNNYWKAFVGWVTGIFTLKDSTGSSIYDWQVPILSGQIYASRNSSVLWADVSCANSTSTEKESKALNQTNPYLNITTTFNSSTHRQFTVAGKTLSQNSCPSLHSYINNHSQSSSFDEVALSDGNNLVYASAIDQNTQGFDGNNYDFQVLVPEVPDPTLTTATPYYIYLEVR